MRSIFLPTWIEVPLRYALRIVVQKIPPRRRGLRLVDGVNRFFPPSNRKFRAKTGKGMAITCDLRDAVQSCIFYRGIYEPEVMERLKTSLGGGDVFLDVGANVGYFTLMASRAVGPTGRVIAFEPGVETASQLRRDIERMGPRGRNVDIHQIALYDREGKSTLVEPPFSASPAGQRYLQAPGNTTPCMGQQIQTVRLDSFLPSLRFDVAKIDVEGAELRVLRGLLGTIQRSNPRLLIVEAEEANLQRFGDSVNGILQLMEKLGYESESVNPADFAPMLIFRPAGHY